MSSFNNVNQSNFFQINSTNLNHQVINSQSNPLVVCCTPPVQAPVQKIAYERLISPLQNNVAPSSNLRMTQPLLVRSEGEIKHILRQARSYLEQKDCQRALGACNQLKSDSISSVEDNVELHNIKIAAYNGTGDYQAAIFECNLIIPLLTSNDKIAQILLIKGFALHNSNRFEEAVNSFCSAIQKVESPSLKNEIIKNLIGYLNRMESLSLKNEIIKNLTERLNNVGRSEEALQILGNDHTLHTQTILIEKARAFYCLERVKEMLEICEKICENPENGEMELAGAYWREIAYSALPDIRSDSCIDDLLEKIDIPRIKESLLIARASNWAKKPDANKQQIANCFFTIIKRSKDKVILAVAYFKLCQMYLFEGYLDELITDSNAGINQIQDKSLTFSLLYVQALAYIKLANRTTDLQQSQKFWALAYRCCEEGLPYATIPSIKSFFNKTLKRPAI